MLAPFQPDHFSQPGPGWVPADDATDRRVRELLAGITDPTFTLTSRPEWSVGLEINSTNLRLTCTRGRFLLKRWSDGAALMEIERTLELMEWLGARGLPVPVPVRLASGTAVIQHAESRWTLYPFFEGRWFSGRQNEIEPAAIACGTLTAALGQLPDRLSPGPGPEHLSSADDDLFSTVERERSRWHPMLGDEHAAMLTDCWPGMMSEWGRLRGDPPSGGTVQAVHFDLHPHNLLLDDGQVTAVLDFEACKIMGTGYAIAFAGLKQCRQAVVAGGDPSAALAIGAAFHRAVAKACPALMALDRFADLALVETLRRLAIILRLNVESGTTTWNRVLPIQLAHLGECRPLFASDIA